jgi:Family of unknown function (DUF6527)
MRKILKEVKSGNKQLLVFYCLGCRRYHSINVNSQTEASWQFNGDFVKPSISPSILIKDMNENIICHSNIKEGMITYEEKGIHDLIGMTLPMSEF